MNGAQAKKIPAEQGRKLPQYWAAEHEGFWYSYAVLNETDLYEWGPFMYYKTAIRGVRRWLRRRGIFEQDDGVIHRRAVKKDGT